MAFSLPILCISYVRFSCYQVAGEEKMLSVLEIQLHHNTRGEIKDFRSLERAAWPQPKPRSKIIDVIYCSRFQHDFLLE